MSALTDQQVASLMPLIHHIANDYFWPGAEHDDVVQEALVGLIAAHDSYDPAREVPFEAFAAIIIRRRLITQVKASRREKRRPEHEDWLLTDLNAPSVAPADVEAAAHRTLRGILDALPSLTPLERRALVGIAVGVPCEQLGNKKSLDNAVQRARAKLREAA